MLKIQGPIKVGSNFELYEAVDEERAEPLYSCVFVYRGSWNEGWPALGGTRAIGERFGGFAEARQFANDSARQLASAMTAKNKLLRDAAQEAYGDDRLFGWNGGKGIIWAPDLRLSPERLMAHGQLVESMKGLYIASEDQHVGKNSLRWIERSTQYTIGLGCKKDTGEGTASGVVAGLCRAAELEGLVSEQFNDRELAEILARGLDSGLLAGLNVLILGMGKVGLPLAGFLDSLGAEVYAFDPVLSTHGAEGFYRAVLAKGGAVDQTHLKLLAAMENGGRVFGSEEDALTDPRIHVISPNGGHTSYFASPLAAGGPIRAEIISAAKQSGAGNLRLILGAGNDQIPGTADRQQQREAALSAFDGAGLHFVPDAVVSPGGVIAVSHELAEDWLAENVIRDACVLVGASVKRLYSAAAQSGGTGALSMYKAFEALHGVSAD